MSGGRIGGGENGSLSIYESVDPGNPGNFEFILTSLGTAANLPRQRATWTGVLNRNQESYTTVNTTTTTTPRRAQTPPAFHVIDYI
jgi:hypothetical protein